MNPVRLAIVGCGAVTELYHLPAAQETDQVQVTVLVDRNLPRAQRLAEQYKVECVLDDYQALDGRADAAIVALPHYLHAPVSVELLRHGIHVLVEKPMALTIEECDRMIEAARQSGAILTVGLVRRFYAASRFVKQLLDEGWLGQIRSFDVREGAIYSWPVASDFFFRQEAAGGGVLVDTGAYTLDMLLWWLGDYEGVEYYDDAMGGVEANCELHLTLKNGVKGIVELSRTRALRNTCLIKGECGILEIGVGFNPTVCLELCDRSARLEGRVLAQRFSQESFLDVMRQQLEDFARAVFGEGQPFVPGEEGRRSIALFEACYKAQQPLELPWLRPESLVNQARCT